MTKVLGPNFANDKIAAGLLDVPFSWTDGCDYDPDTGDKAADDEARAKLAAELGKLDELRQEAIAADLAELDAADPARPGLEAELAELERGAPSADRAAIEAVIAGHVADPIERERAIGRIKDECRRRILEEYSQSDQANAVAGALKFINARNGKQLEPDEQAYLDHLVVADDWRLSALDHCAVLVAGLEPLSEAERAAFDPVADPGWPANAPHDARFPGGRGPKGKP